jgi:hypothetical protein
MRTVILALTMMLCAASADAQYFYKVYTVKGNVTCEKRKVEPGHLLHIDWQLSIPSNGKLVLLDEKEKQLITLREEGEGSVRSHLQKKGNKKKEVSGKYMSYISDKVSTKHLVDPSLYMQSRGAVIRKPNGGNESNDNIIIIQEEPNKNP